MNNEIKIYQIEIDYENDDLGMMRNSFVEMPAVEYTKLDFAKQSKQKQIISFAADSSEQRFMSVSMVADTPIPRIDDFTGELFGIEFSKDTIKKIVNKFVMEGNTNEVSFQHTDTIIDGVYLVEHFITRKGVVEATAFKDLPEGSWITTYWVKDKAQYEALKADESFNGFSIEISANLEEMYSMSSYDAVYDAIEVVVNSGKSDEEIEAEIKELLKIK